MFGIEPGQDLANGARAVDALRAAKVVCFTPFTSPELRDAADVLLPIGTFGETAGTFVNAEGLWQSFDAAADLAGDSRPGWRVLRVLGNELGLADCEYRTPSEVSAALEQELGGRATLGAEHSAYRGALLRPEPARQRSTPASSMSRSTQSTRSCAAPRRCS